MIRIPLIPETPDYTFSTVLEGLSYGFRIQWNSRDESWYMTLSDQEGNVIRSGIRLVMGKLPGRRSVNPDFPPGTFMIRNLIDGTTDANYTNVGTSVFMYYLTQEEFLGE